MTRFVNEETIGGLLADDSLVVRLQHEELVTLELQPTAEKRVLLIEAFRSGGGLGRVDLQGIQHWVRKSKTGLP